MKQKHEWAKKSNPYDAVGDYEACGAWPEGFVAGFNFAKEKLAEKMDKDCYDQECGFSSNEIRNYGEEDV